MNKCRVGQAPLGNMGQPALPSNRLLPLASGKGLALLPPNTGGPFSGTWVGFAFPSSPASIREGQGSGLLATIPPPPPQVTHVAPWP